MRLTAISILVPRCLRLAGSYANGARALVDSVCGRAAPIVRQLALRQEAAAAMPSSTALFVTGYLCKRGRQRWLVSESDASASFRGSNRPLSARRTASSKSLVELSETRAKPKRGLEPCIRLKRARARLAESAGRSRAGCGLRFLLFGPVQNGHHRKPLLARLTNLDSSAHIWTQL